MLRFLVPFLFFVVAARAQEGAAAPGDQVPTGGDLAPKNDATAKPQAKTKKSNARSKTRSPGPASASGSAAGETATSSSARAHPTELATFGAGCFWHVEDVFERQKGVKSAVSGYSGGNVPEPSYEMVHTGITGHAEVVQVEYDPNVISYEKLLKIFWSCHDPTSINRQGPDEGPQYRSVIFYHNEEQKKAALKSYEQLTRARVFNAPIVTELVPMLAFFPAEDYHQDYYRNLRRPAARHRKATAKAKAKAIEPKSKAGAQAASKPD
jgi:peptide-methionine (S)-S-oxide reductase